MAGSCSGKHQPVVGGHDDLGGGAHGAALGEVAANRAALMIGHGQVQVAAVLRQGAGEGEDLEGALPGAMFGPAGQPHPDLRQAADAGQNPARLDAFVGGERHQLILRSAPGRNRRAIVRMPRGYRPHWGVEEGHTAGVSAGVAVLAYLANGVLPQVPAGLQARGVVALVLGRPVGLTWPAQHVRFDC